MNQSAIKELNELINKEYVIEVKLSQSFILDSYNEGELEETYYTPEIYSTKHWTTAENIKQDLRDVLNYLMEDVVRYGTLEKYYRECFNYTDSDIVSLRQTNIDGEIPTIGEFELWQIEEYKLYNEYTAFNIYINGTKIGADLISKLIESEEYNVEQAAV